MRAQIAFYAAVLRRHLAWFLGVVVPIGGGALVLALMLPPVYRAQGTLGVAQPAVPLQLIGLRPDAGTSQPFDTIESHLRAAATLRTLAAGLAAKDSASTGSPVAAPTPAALERGLAIVTDRPRGRAPTMTIAYEGPRPEQAARVVDALVATALREDRRDREARAGQRLAFFDHEEARVGAALDAVDQRIMTFKRANAGALPEDRGFMQQQRLVLQQQLAQTAREGAAVVDQRARVADLLRSTRMQDRAATGAAAEPAALAGLQRRLRAARAVYSASNPKVTMLEAEIATLKAAPAAGPVTVPKAAGAPATMAPRPAMRSEPGAASPGTGAMGVSPGTGAMDATAGTGAVDGSAARPAGVPETLLRLQLADIQSRLAALAQQERAIRDRIAALDARLARIPDHALVLDDLMRSQAGLRTQLAAAEANRARAEAALRADSGAAGPHLVVTEWPAVPEHPVRPHRMRIAALGGFAALLAGLAVVALLEMGNRTIRRPSELVRMLGVTPIASLPRLEAPAPRRRGAAAVFGLACVVLVLPLALWLVERGEAPVLAAARQLAVGLGIRV